MSRRVPWSLALVVGLLTALPARLMAGQPLEFHVTFHKSVSEAPFTGRVFVMLSYQPISELMPGPDWFKPAPFFALDVKGWKPGEPLVFGASALGFPGPMPKMPPGTYWLQAVMDFDRGGHKITRSEGNGYSKAVQLALDPARSGTVKLTIDRVYKEPPFRETGRVKLMDVESKLLTEFHRKPMRLRAAVVLPKSFGTNPEKRYPVIYEIPGFGGTHEMAHGAAARNATEVAGVEMLYVMLDPMCRLGHHVFADSENNGPCGKALVEELIPHLERTYRGLGTPGARFVTGHSSGGWSSLWLQVAYPDFFGGVWSTAPDPVDFRDFQRVNLYEPGVSLFVDGKDQKRPLARMGNTPIIWYRAFSDMEVVMGRGGQLFSFEAVFSPRGPDGKPRPLWDRATGKVNLGVALAWQKYDIRLVLERNWKTLAPKLAGKLHVYMGSRDNFYLEGATVLLKKTLENLGSDAVVEIFPDRDHGSLMDRDLRDRIAREMAERSRKGAKKGAA